MQYVGIASFTVLIWDHIVTLDDEVRCPSGVVAYR